MFEISKKRIFVPLIKPNIKEEFLQRILGQSKYVAFNYYELQKQKSIYFKVKKKGLHDFFNIPDKHKVFLTSTAPDSYLLMDLFNRNSKKFKTDVLDINPDFFMGPDLLAYKDLLKTNNDCFVNEAIKLGLECTDIEGFIPNIHGIHESQREKYVETFKQIGYKDFILTGREFIVNQKGRINDERILSTIIRKLKKNHKINILITGPSTPRQHKILDYADGFIGLGYYTSAMERILCDNYKSIHILSNPSFRCFYSCCNGLNVTNLSNSKNDSTRIIHNLLTINRMLNIPIREVQMYLN